jgi:hypothetical protein
VLSWLSVNWRNCELCHCKNIQTNSLFFLLWYANLNYLYIVHVSFNSFAILDILVVLFILFSSECRSCSTLTNLNYFKWGKHHYFSLTSVLIINKRKYCYKLEYTSFILISLKFLKDHSKTKYHNHLQNIMFLHWRIKERFIQQ